MNTFTLFFISTLFIISFEVMADNGAKLNSIYKLFMQNDIVLSTLKQRYSQDVIHGAKQSALIVGWDAFLKKNIEPIAAMLKTGQLKIEMEAFVVRRTVGLNLADENF